MLYLICYGLLCYTLCVFSALKPYKQTELGKKALNAPKKKFRVVELFRYNAKMTHRKTEKQVQIYIQINIII